MNDLPKSVAGNPLLAAVASGIQDLQNRYSGYRKRQVYADAFERGATQLSVKDAYASIEQLGVWQVLSWLRDYTAQGSEELFGYKATPSAVLDKTRPEALADLLIDKIPYVLLNQSALWVELDDDDEVDEQVLAWVWVDVAEFLNAYRAPDLLFYALARLI